MGRERRAFVFSQAADRGSFSSRDDAADPLVRFGGGKSARTSRAPTFVARIEGGRIHAAVELRDLHHEMNRLTEWVHARSPRRRVSNEPEGDEGVLTRFWAKAPPL